MIPGGFNMPTADPSRPARFPGARLPSLDVTIVEPLRAIIASRQGKLRLTAFNGLKHILHAPQACTQLLERSLIDFRPIQRIVQHNAQSAKLEASSNVDLAIAIEYLVSFSRRVRWNDLFGTGYMIASSVASGYRRKPREA